MWSVLEYQQKEFKQLRRRIEMLDAYEAASSTWSSMMDVRFSRIEYAVDGAADESRGVRAAIAAPKAAPEGLAELRLHADACLDENR